MRILKDESGQVGGIIMAIAAFFIIGFIYILLGAIVQKYVFFNGVLQANTGLPYSAERGDAMDSLFRYWWAIPLITILVIALYAYKNSTDSKDPQEAY